MNICLYKGNFNYDVINYFVDELEDRLIRIGHNVSVVDLKEVRNDIEINELIDYLKNKKIELVVAYMCYFENGSHERVFSAMLNDALVVSNKNNYSFNMYKDKESIIYYDAGNFNNLVSNVKYYLQNEDERNQVVNKAYDITSKYNTWGNRADEIIELYDIVKNMK